MIVKTVRFTQKHRQTVRRPLVVVVDAGNVFATGLLDGLVADRTGTAVNLIAHVTDARIV